MSKKVYKLFLSVFVTFMFFIGTINAEECMIHVGDKVLDSDNTEISDGKGGTITWDSDTSTLTLNNFYYEGPGVYLDLDDDSLNIALGIQDYNDEVKIIVNGKNTFKLLDETVDDELAKDIESDVWYFENDIEIDGTGELNLYNNEKKYFSMTGGIFAKKYSINNITLNINGVKTLDAIYGLRSRITSEINNANVNFTSPDVYSEEVWTASIGFWLEEDDDNKLSIIDSNVTMNIGSAYAINAFYVWGSLLIENSFLDVKLFEENEDDECNIYAFYVTNDFSAEDSIILANSGLSIFDVGSVNVVFSNTIAELSGNEGLFSDEYGITFNNYTNKIVFVSSNSDGSGATVWNGSDNLYDYKYIKVKLGSTEGKRIVNIPNRGISAMVKDYLNVASLTEKEKVLVENGKDVLLNIILNSTVSDEDKQLIKNKVKDSIIANYYNIEISKTIDNVETKLTDLNSKVILTVPLDESLINKDETKIRTYSIARVHDGNVEILDVTQNKLSNTLQFESDKFSTYALLYKDEDIEKEPEEIVPGGKETPENPKTGDNAYVYFIGGIFSFVLVVGLLSILKKSNQ